MVVEIVSLAATDGAEEIGVGAGTECMTPAMTAWTREQLDGVP